MKYVLLLAASLVLDLSLWAIAIRAQARKDAKTDWSVGGDVPGWWKEGGA